MPNFAGYRLGRRPHDPTVIARMPQLSGHALATMPVPARLDRSHIAFAPGLYGNDRIGDCTAVGVANAARAQACLSGFDIPMPESKVIEFYSRTTGYNPNATPVDGENPTDQGGIEADVLAWQIRNGFDHGGQDLLVGDFANFDAHDMGMHRRVMARCGTGYLGVALALADQTSDVWDTNTPGDQAPGSWGLHCLLEWSYAGTSDTDLITLITWGEKQPATWRWLRSRVQEAHVLIWRQLLNTNGQNFCGLDFDRLRADGLRFAT